MKKILVIDDEAGFEDYFIKPADIKTMVKVANDAFEKIDRWKRK